MITQRAFTVEPWVVRETNLDLDRIAQAESVFALSNGHVGVRGNLDEGEPYGLLGTYLGGVYETRPLPYAEAGYGFPEDGQTVVNVHDGKVIRLLVEDEPLDVRYGKLRAHERTLDLRAGTLSRTLEWESPSGRAIRVSSVRMVSFTQRAITAIEYVVEPVDGPVRIAVQSELVANEPSETTDPDPRGGAALQDPLVAEAAEVYDHSLVLVHRTRTSGLRVGAAMCHRIDGPDHTAIDTDVLDDLGRVTVATTLEPGQRLRIVKLVAHGWSSRRSLPAVRAQVAGALAEARHAGWDQLLADQRAFLDTFWDHADVELDGDAEVQQAVRFGLFHVLQAGARAEQRAIPAKGLTGPGYDGHAFWDTESFVLPVLTYTQPDAAADALRWRHSTLPQARERAKQLELDGAVFPWRTIAGEECSGYWPAGSAAFHVNADIADAAIRYYQTTQDETFAREVGVELLVETARMWRSLGHHDPEGHFRIDGVTGPDEYSAVADNNTYTNLMAQQNLRAAAIAVERYRDVGSELKVSPEESASWRDAADAMTIPYDEALGVHQQAEDFTQHQHWNFEATREDQYPLLLHFPYFQLYRTQVVKQADLVMAMFTRGDAFTAAEKLRNFAYYEPLTVRDSSLSACVQSIMAAEVGHTELAYDYLGEAALMDLDDLEHNTRDGVHIASLAGAWTALVAGLGGLRDVGGQLRFAPRLPEALGRLKFHLGSNGRRLSVEVVGEEVTYLLRDGDDLVIRHHGDEVELVAGRPVTLPVPPAPTLAPVRQPAGRVPARRTPSSFTR